MKRHSAEFLKDILESLDFIEIILKDVDFEKFKNSPEIYFSVIKNVENIGEALKNVPKEILENYPETPWKNWIATRDRLVHAYFHIDLQIVWHTVQLNTNSLRKQVKLILENI